MKNALDIDRYFLSTRIRQLLFFGSLNCLALDSVKPLVKPFKAPRADS